jgi:hypothetical protein
VTAKPFLLDTSVLLFLVRGKQLGLYIDKTFDLSHAVHRPLVSIVSHGELWALAARHGWGTAKTDALTAMLDNMVTVDLNDRSVIDAYVECRLLHRLLAAVRAFYRRMICGLSLYKSGRCCSPDNRQRLSAFSPAALSCYLYSA